VTFRIASSASDRLRYCWRSSREAVEHVDESVIQDILRIRFVGA